VAAFSSIKVGTTFQPKTSPNYYLILVCQTKNYF